MYSISSRSPVDRSSFFAARETCLARRFSDASVAVRFGGRPCVFQHLRASPDVAKPPPEQHPSARSPQSLTKAVEQDSLLLAVADRPRLESEYTFLKHSSSEDQYNDYNRVDTLLL